MLVWGHATLVWAGVLVDATGCLPRGCLAREVSRKWDDPEHQHSMRHTAVPSDHGIPTIWKYGHEQ